MIIIYRQALFIAGWLLISFRSFAADVPTLDLQSGTSYRAFRQAGLQIREGKQYRPGARSNDFILEKTLRVVIAPGKSFTLEGRDETGAVGVSADESTIEGLFLFGAYPTPEATKKKLQEIGGVLGFSTEGFDTAIDNKRPGWTALGDAAAPYWTLEVSFPGLPNTPYQIRIVFMWDLDLLKKVSGKAFFIRDMQRK